MTRFSVIAFLLLLPLAACNGEREDLKSPCAGNPGSPCGPHRAVNDWWIS